MSRKYNLGKAGGPCEECLVAPATPDWHPYCSPRCAARSGDIRGIMAAYRNLTAGIDPEPRQKLDKSDPEPTPTCPDHPGDYGTNCRACEEDKRRYREWRERKARRGQEG